MIKPVRKVWGHEYWHLNSDRLCGKTLEISRGYRCSTHLHRIKEEAFYVLSGSCLICIEGVIQKAEEGDFFHIPTGTKHWFGVPSGWDKKCSLMEMSTHHDDADVERFRESGELSSTVLVNGCFDLFHRGHAAFLSFADAVAKSIGCSLLVAVNDDESVRKLKGDGRPINSLAERLNNTGKYAKITFNGDLEDAIAKLVVPPVLVIRGHDQRVEPELEDWVRAPKFGNVSTTNIVESGVPNCS